MPYNRIYDEFPSLETIQALEGAFVVEEQAPGQVVNARVGRVAIIGETLKGAPNVPVEIAGPADFIANCGAFNKFVGDGASAAHPYDGNVAIAIAGAIFAGSYVVVPVNDRVGVVTVTRVSPGAASLLSTNLGPYTLADADTLIVADDVGTDGTATINAEAASDECANGANFDFTGNTVLTLQVNGGALQSYDISSDGTTPSAINAVSQAELVTWINSVFTGIQATPTGTNQVTVSTDRKGLTASLLFGGSARSVAGFSASAVNASTASGDNNVNDVDAVTVDELVDLINAQVSRTTASNSGGYLLLTRDTEGASATLTISGTIPGIDPAGKVKFDTSLGPIAGGTDTAPSAVLPAGTRISDGGSNVFMLAADTAFAEGALSVTAIPIKQASGSTVSASAIDTFVDTPDTDSFNSPTVTNPADTTAKPASESAWDTVYQDALEALEADEPVARSVNIIISARHGVEGVAIGSLTGALMKSFTDHCTTMQGRGVPRITFVSPPLATPKATARGSSGVGISSTTAGGRNKRRGYGWPGYSKAVPAIVKDDPSLTGIIDWTTDVLMATKASLLAPELSLSQPGTELKSMLGLESYYTAAGTGDALTQVDYTLNKAAGICSPRVDTDNGQVLQSQVMSVDPSTAPDDVKISDRRMRDFLYASLLKFAGPKQSKLSKPSRRRRIGADIAGWLQGLTDDERIAAYIIQEDTPASYKGTGVFIWRMGVQLLDHLDHLGFRVTASRSLNVEDLL